MKCFAIKDEKAEGFNIPFFKPTPGVAEREFRELGKNKETTVGRNPEDFTLWMIGEFDQNTGNIEPVKPVQICSLN